MKTINAIPEKVHTSKRSRGFRSGGAGLVFGFLMMLSMEFPLAASGASFPIATKGASFSYAFDGRNYLVGIEDYQSTSSVIAAQMIDATGAKVGPLIKPNRSGIATTVAYDGTNYLMVWEDDQLGALQDGYQVYGQFISKAGKAVGVPFAISDANIWLDGIKVMAFGAGKYLVTYTRLIIPANGDASNNRFIGGRIVNPDGTMGNKFRISKGFGDQSDVAFDGTNFFVVWTEDSQNKEIRGRFVSPAGLCGAEISVNASAAPSDNPKSVAFDGTNYLVVWNDEMTGPRQWDVFGQRVSPSGALVGGVIPITRELGQQMVTSVAFDGINYMAAWIDMQNGTNWDVYGQVLGRDGVLVGAKKAISTAAGNQIGGVGFANGTYLALISSGVIMGDAGLTKVDAAYGVFVTPPARRIMGLSGNLSFGNVYRGQTATATLTITNGGNRVLTVSGITYPAGFSGAWSGSLAAGQTANVTVTFAPGAVQAYGGTVTVNSDMTGGANTIPVSGFGMSAALPGQIRFDSSTYVAREGTKAYVYVNRIYGSSGTVSVTYMTKPKTALAGQDYITKSNTLVWAHGQTATRVIPVSILTDAFVEGDETFQVVLRNPVGATLAAPFSTTITIKGNN